MTVKLGVVSRQLVGNAALRSAFVKGGWGDRNQPLDKMLRARITLARTSIEIKMARERELATKARAS